MACEQFLELIETEVLAIEEIDAEISQLMDARAARQGTIFGYWMQYQLCMNGQGQMLSGLQKIFEAMPSNSELLKLKKSNVVK